nr:P1 family peptidase [uncultured Mogibacterium sp.]
MGFKRIDVKEINGFKLGNAENQSAGTGCTVIISEQGAVAGVDVRGGGPATRETDLLKSENTVQSINAVVLSGGSAFGLEAGSGVMRYLEEKGVGFKVGERSIPIVTQASLFDLEVGSGDIRPDRDMGVQACINAYEGVFDHGNHGAGTGASVGKFYGMDRAMKSSLGTFACSDGVLEVGAITAVNAFGDVYNGNNNIIAGLLSKDKDYIKGSISVMKNHVHGEGGPEAPDIRDPFKSADIDTTIRIDDSEVVDLATEKNDETVVETGTQIYENEASERLPQVNTVITDNDRSEIDEIESKIEELRAELENNLNNHESEHITGSIQEEPEYEPIPVEEMGYDVPFNTTLSCLITNAKLSKTQANKLASILHDGFARAIKPVHGTLDGDAIFVMTTNQVEVNFDAFAALATDILQYSVIDGALAATDAYGLKASRSIISK